MLSITRTIIPFLFATFDIPTNNQYHITGFRFSILGLFVLYSSWQRKQDIGRTPNQPITNRRHVATIFKYPTSHWSVNFNSEVSDTDRIISLLQFSAFVLPKVSVFRTLLKRIFGL
eukprot:TRINITY_DN2860_c0_g2_i1.p1 TRINITY_DN2860_c0_g2~~TRINITY_DN2860_c0_g2_i1.p1  ORF type:complete len:116 (-),score=4.78 TRINITY_DN2860_c0_g2_i1:59-406(-)